MSPCRSSLLNFPLPGILTLRLRLRIERIFCGNATNSLNITTSGFKDRDRTIVLRSNTAKQYQKHRATGREVRI